MRNWEFDVIFDSQRIFRSLLDAMANPGRIITLPDIRIKPPAANMYPLLLLMTLLDHEVSFSVLDSGALVTEYLKTNTGSKESRLENSDFILVYGGSSHGLIQGAKVGTLEYPDESATVIYDAGSIGDSDGDVLLELSGPGIADKRKVGASGIEETEIGDVLAMQDYPLGLDLIFSDNAGRIACIPRSTTMKVI
ncbi:MAG: phosphonate C-P lyase system protein PhnH [Euryarchaeota archaeon]|nr:phosphonate C-P lyase system protein PhnH [Euryarchaeota archaeon]